MAPLVSLLIVLTISLIITRIATVALTLTGLSHESARFQARSAFTGVGFTTSEAESVVNHPVRRRVLMMLMMMGNAGIVTVMASLILGFLNTSGRSEALSRMLFLLAGLFVILLIARSRWVEQRMNRLIVWALTRWTDLDLRDYANLFKLSDGYAVTEIAVADSDWLAAKTLGTLALTGEGVLVLGIHRRDGTYIGAPTGTTEIRPGDRLIAYGRSQHLSELDSRRPGHEGELAHRAAVDEQARVLEEQEVKVATSEQDDPESAEKNV